MSREEKKFSIIEFATALLNFRWGRVLGLLPRPLGYIIAIIVVVSVFLLVAKKCKKEIADPEIHNLANWCTGFFSKKADTCIYTISISDIDTLTDVCCDTGKYCNIFFIDNSKSVEEARLEDCLNPIKKVLASSQTLGNVSDQPLSKLIALCFLDKMALRNAGDYCAVYSMDKDGKCVSLANKGEAGSQAKKTREDIYGLINDVKAYKHESDTTNLEKILNAIKENIEWIKGEDQEITAFNIYLISDLLDDELRRHFESKNEHLRKARERDIWDAIGNLSPHVHTVHLIPLPHDKTEKDLSDCLTATKRRFMALRLFSEGKIKTVEMESDVPKNEGAREVMETISIPHRLKFEYKGEKPLCLRFCPPSSKISSTISIIQNKKSENGQAHVIRIIPFSRQTSKDDDTPLVNCYKSHKEHPIEPIGNKESLRLNEFHYFTLDYDQTLNLELLHDQTDLLNAKIALELYHIGSNFGIVMPFEGAPSR